MKKVKNLKLLWLSLLSMGVLAIFLWIGTGSTLKGFLWEASTIAESVYLGDGVRKNTYTTGEDVPGCDNAAVKAYTGAQDPQGRWDGPVTIEHGQKSNKIGSDQTVKPKRTEKVTMVAGVRHGKSTMTWHKWDGDVDSVKCYDMGKVIDCQKSITTSTANRSAFKILKEEFPWFMAYLSPYDFEDEYIKAYLDTFETILLAMEYTGGDFLDYYSNALDSLEETGYDSIQSVHGIQNIHLGLDEMKNSEFRLAVIDQSRMTGSNTFDIVKTKYPDYLQLMNMTEINDQDFEMFCNKFDSLTNSYGTLDMEDPFFVDSVDSYLWRGLSFILSIEEDTTEATKSLKSAPAYESIYTQGRIWRKVQSVSDIDESKTSLPDVGFAVFGSMIIHYFEGDIISKALEESFNNQHSIISIPTVTTEYLGSDSPTGANLNGYIHEDGGAAITSSGIAWATHYNPTISDNTENSSTISGSFIIALDGLTEGATYFARTFATNSAGTAYGNCVEFTATSTVGIESVEFDHKFNIYPNPASDIVTFRFMAESLDPLELSIINLKGQVVYHHEIAGLSPGDHQIELDLSDLNVGIYNCQLSARGSVNATRKLLILH